MKKHILIGVSVFLVILVLTQYLAYQRYRLIKELELEQVSQEANFAKDKLKSALRYSLSATKTLAFIVENYGVPNNFDSLAKAIIASNKNIDALELTRKGVITHVYPLEGNLGAIGYDVLKDSTRNAEAFRAIEKRELFFAGPFQLKQGGVAVVGRLPIFINGEFFGFSAVLIKLSTLLQFSGMADTATNKAFRYQLSKINPVTQEEEFFLSGKGPDSKEQFVSVEVPDGAWKLYVIPQKKSFSFHRITFVLIGLLLSVTAGLYASSLSEKPEKLGLLVQQAYEEKETIMSRINDSVVALDTEWRYTFLNDAALTTHPQGREHILGRTMLEIHPEMKDTIFWNKFQEAMHTQTVQEVEGLVGSVWFLAKAYPSPDGITIFYQDISVRKKIEQEILREKNLSEAIINSLPGIFYLYTREGKFIRWNKNFEIVSGYNANEISNMTPLDFFDRHDQPLLREKIDEVFATGQAEVMAPFYNKQGNKLHYYFTGHKVVFNAEDYLTGVGIDISKQVEAEEKLRERASEIQKLTAHLEEVREEERLRMSREIHDELGQQLTGLKMDISWVAKRILLEDNSLREKLSTMVSLVDETVKTVRRISSELRPGILDDLGLIPALEWQTQEFEKRTGIRANFKSSVTEFAPDRNPAINIFRVYQEILTNVARHSQATKVDTNFTVVEGSVMLTVQDNGVGFDVEKVKAKKSLGLIGMRERALLFGGVLTIQSAEGKGTTITLYIPAINPSLS